MVKEKTKKFVQNNRELLKEVAKNGSPKIKPMALAFLLAVPEEPDSVSSENVEKTSTSDSTSPKELLREVAAGAEE